LTAHQMKQALRSFLSAFFIACGKNRREKPVIHVQGGGVTGGSLVIGCRDTAAARARLRRAPSNDRFDIQPLQAIAVLVADAFVGDDRMDLVEPGDAMQSHQAEF
jgi:hypothetical protein